MVNAAGAFTPEAVSTYLASKAANSIVTRATEGALIKYEGALREAAPFMKHLGAYKMNRCIRAYPILEKRVRELEDRFDHGKAENFCSMSIRYFEAAMKEHREFKLHLLAAACAHCAVRDNTDSFDEQLEFFDAIERLQPFHMVILKYLDEHHVEKLSGGRHEHHLTCNFDELMSAPFRLPEPRKHWLANALIRLQNLNTILVWGGGSTTTGKHGHLETVTEPWHVVQNGRIGLVMFGCHLLKYLEHAWAEADTDIDAS